LYSAAWVRGGSVCKEQIKRGVREYMSKYFHGCHSVRLVSSKTGNHGSEVSNYGASFAIDGCQLEVLQE